MRFRSILFTSFVGSLCLAAFFVPLRVHYTNIFVGAAVLFWLIQSPAFIRSTDKKIRMPFFIFISLYLIQIIGLIHTDNLSWGLFMLETKLSLLIFPLIILLSPLSKENGTWVLRMFSLGVLITCLLGHYHVIVQIIGEKLPWHSFASNELFYNFRFTDAINIHPTYLTVSIGIVIFYVLENEYMNVKNKALLTGVMLYLVFCLVILMSRAGLAAVAFACIAYVYITLIRRKKIILGVSLFILMAIGTFLLMRFIPELQNRMVDSMQNMEEKVEAEEPTSPNWHAKQWYCAIHSFDVGSLIIGHGTGDEEDTLVKCYAENEWDYLVEVRLDSHNEYLSSTMKHGLIGLALLLFVYGYALSVAIRSGNILYCTFCVMVIVYSIGSSVLFGQTSLVIYAFFNSLFLKLATLDTKK